MGFYPTMMAVHFPTLLLLIGYPVYWIELFFFSHPYGHSTWLATILAAPFLLWLLMRQRFSFGFVLGHKCLWAPLLLVLGIMAIALAGSLLPPHLLQEFDALNYHITIPRQHLLTGSFAHLPWSSADLFLLPLDFALAPFWLVTELPNKFPQFVFFFLLPWLVGRVVKSLGGNLLQACLAAFLVLGAHGMGIQAGTAMLDVVVCYLALAALDSFLNGRVVLAAIELAFFAASKPAMPLLCLVLGVVVWMIFLSVRHLKFISSWHWGFLPDTLKLPLHALRRFWIVFAAAFILLAGPFMVKSFYYTGAPLYPLGAGFVKPLKPASCDHVNEMIKRAHEHMKVKDQYGASRGFADFLAHFWVVAVPEKGVNNRFDYPLGLPILLVIIPFIYFLINSIRKRHFSLLSWIAVVYWFLWWMGTQQSRFLFVPMVLVIMLAILALPRLSKVLWGAVVVALAFTLLSLWRVHAADFSKKPMELLREADQKLLSMPVLLHAVVEVDTPDAAFAPFVVNVKKENGFYVLTK